MFQQQQASLTEQIQQLQGERDEATNRLAAQAQENATAREVPAELLRRRSQVGTLREQLRSAANAARRASAARGARRSEDVAPNALDLARSNQLLTARAVIFSTTAAVTNKLEALRLLRSANARSEDIVRQMIRIKRCEPKPASALRDGNAAKLGNAALPRPPGRILPIS